MLRLNKKLLLSKNAYTHTTTKLIITPNGEAKFSAKDGLVSLSIAITAIGAKLIMLCCNLFEVSFVSISSAVLRVFFVH